MGFQFFSSISGKRAATKIEQLEYQILDYDQLDDMSQADEQTLDRIKHIIKGAQKALDEGKTELAWQLLHSVQRVMLYLDSETALSFKKQALYQEANKKLKGWRRNTVLETLNSETEENPLSTDMLKEAYGILHEHFSNVYIKNKKILTQLFTLSVTALAALILFLTVIWSFPNLELAGDLTLNTETLVPIILSVLLFGVMGACLSAIFSLAGGSDNIKIPKLQVNYWITLSRPIIGAISALVLFIFITSDLILPEQNPNTAGVLTISFIAGFSERLIIRAVKTVTDESSLDLNSNSKLRNS